MKITHLGHAGFAVTHHQTRLLIDPWFNPAFLYSWFPWPANQHMQEEIRECGEYIDVIYISHHHEDHFDREWLKTRSRDTDIVIANFRSRYLKKELEKLGFERIWVLDHGEELLLYPHMKLTMLMDKSHKEDSALLVEADGVRFLDSNDCELAASDWPEDIDILAAQFSGAFWYPSCYNYPDDVKTAKGMVVQDANLERLFQRVRATGAKAYIPSAGPAIFLDPALTHHNACPSFPHWDEVEERFVAEFPEVEIIQSLEGGLYPTEYQREQKSQWEKYQELDDTPVTHQEIANHFARLCKMNKAYLGDWRKDVFVGDCDATGSLIRLGLVAPELEECPEPEYWMFVPNQVLRAVIDGKTGWEEALHSMRIALGRDPDVYDAKLMTLLQYGQRPARTVSIVRNNENSEMIVKNDWEFQRWCPHAREDLNFAIVEDGILVCPRHEWCWDLRTGNCVSGQRIPIRTNGRVTP